MGDALEVLQKYLNILTLTGQAGTSLKQVVNMDCEQFAPGKVITFEF
jgi:hypothetical protein